MPSSFGVLKHGTMPSGLSKKTLSKSEGERKREVFIVSYYSPSIAVGMVTLSAAKPGRSSNPFPTLFCSTRERTRLKLLGNTIGSKTSSGCGLLLGEDG